MNKQKKITSLDNLLIEVVILILIISPQSIQAQQMNGAKGIDDGTPLSTNVFLTDNGNLDHLIHYQPSSGWVFYAQKFHEAETFPESRPADKDPEGHWGKSSGGVQLSMRMHQTNFHVGEPLMANLYIRNVGDKMLEYRQERNWKWPLPQLSIIITRNGSRIDWKPTTNELIAGGPSSLLIPHTQHKYEFDLTKFYDLTNAGTYDLQASFEKAKTAVVTINITNATVNSP